MRLPIRRTDGFALILLWAMAAPAASDGLTDGAFVRADDLTRLSALNEAAGQALLGAFAKGDPGDLAVLADALAGPALPPDDALSLLPGDWSCRTIKLGGGLPIVVYQPFRCRVDADHGFEKLSGSQRSKGSIHQDDGQLVYLGTGFIAGDTPPAYASLPKAVDPQATPQRMPEIGMVEITAPDRGRIIFPLPHLESRLNLLVLRR